MIVWKSVTFELTYTYHIARLVSDWTCVLSQGTSRAHRSRSCILVILRRDISFVPRTFVAILGHILRL